ncbi:acyl-CoA dehydratase activase [Propionispora vibrioides]|uniref:CoA-substrate-specific enzyme activase, putative n=1 Tax=Propionispora vibrioides TaxID=112903 RepID=A0A1H8XDH8_9FIRM|nr:acyl-CoA dehydratase activase [Propionispora vibrioides]SEP37777.1 CoA-substrate-specific enzyme activase, putative [Propionispora vibrioides]
MYHIGIDIGYATFKYIILKETATIDSGYLFHRGNIDAAVNNLLTKIEKEYNIRECYFGIAGEQAERMPNLKQYVVNEMTALIEGAFASDPSLRTIIELGAQKAKYVTNVSAEDKAHIKFSMNSSCSAGTGSFLEEQVSRLGISLYEYSDYVKKATHIPRIAGRCSVFSKTDMIHHQQEGVKTEDILLGLAYALVRNFKANVVQKEALTPPVMLTGGVVYNKGVIAALKAIFQLEDKDIIIPTHFDKMIAFGAALLAKEQQMTVTVEELKTAVGPSQQDKNKKETNGYPALYPFGQNESSNKHTCHSAENIEEGYLGIDIGSTSTNLVLIDQGKKVIAYRYLRTRGKPRQVVSDGIAELAEQFKHQIRIKGIGTTGSGRYLIGNELGAGIIVDEITAQAKGAVAADPEVDTIFEIGGQDSKYIRLQNGMVVDFEMNKICAAGTGSFIEEQAKKLAIPIESFSQLALKSENPLNLGDRCTVFIEGNTAKALANNESKNDIAAGLAYSIVNNYLNRVVGTRSIGKKIFLQGGIAYNQAVVNAFRAVLKKEILIPPFFSVTGALGAALLLQEKMMQDTQDVSRDKNNESSAPCNILQEMESLFLKNYTGAIDKTKLTIGIPRVLFLHKLFPLFHEVFKTLGFNVILSKATDEDIVALSQEYSMDETCYPIKLINGHVASLLKQGVDYIFLPSLYTMKHDVSQSREDYACVYMQSTSKVIAHVMNLAEKGVKLLSPALSFKFGKVYMMKTLLAMGRELGKNKAQIAFAIMKGMARMKEYSRDVEELNQKVAESLQKEEKAFIIITRTYNTADPILNMKIPQKLIEMGYKVLTLANIPAYDYDVSAYYPNMYWPFGQHILAGAKLVRDMPNLYPIYITNHGCGPDTILSHYFTGEIQGKPYLHIEVDEHSSSVGVITRLEAFINSLDHYDGKTVTAESATEKAEPSGTEAGKLVLPNLYPYSQVLGEWFTKKGIATEVLPASTQKSLEVGKQFTKSKEYVSLFSLLGDVFYHLQNTGEKKVKLWLPQSEGSEVYGQYGKIVSEKLKAAGYQAEVISPFIEDLLQSKEYGFTFALGVILADLVMISAKEERDKVLLKGLDLIKTGGLNEQNLVALAREIYSGLKKKSYDKQLYVLGEGSVIFNGYLNSFQLAALETKHRIWYQPLAEQLLFTWHDHFSKTPKRDKEYKINLAKIKALLKEIGNALAEYNSFDRDFAGLVKQADKKLDLYAGGGGRYRFAKLFRCPEAIHGILMVSSMYENTATIQKMLRNRDAKELSQPVLDLSFDGSSHSNNKEILDTFIHYI